MDDETLPEPRCKYVPRTPMPEPGADDIHLRTAEDVRAYIPKALANLARWLGVDDEHR
jgi:hypothetical protein